MDKVKAMQTFVRIVEANSFSRAAESLHLPRASLTATMKNLEAFLGRQLLQRTTRKLSLTPDGAQYYAHCIDILAAIDASEQPFFGAGSTRPKGKLRIDLPSALARHLILPHIAVFHEAYPEVELGISITDRLVDLIQDGIDCALRVGQLQDCSMIGRQIGEMRFVTCAAPSYLARHGVPRSIADLQGHRSVVHFSARTGRPFDWDFVVGDSVTRIAISGPIAVNDADANLSCALQGLGLTQAATYQVRKHLADGSLVQVLAETPPTPMPVSLLYPQGRMAAPKLAVFAGWLAALFDADPDLASGARDG
ncbi:LysR family transcriptional regulator [Massilia sp. P8910]|uniref:LysR family transcriptional regulator n=1 Tax=Massilia antarctica TaxID=2765360 RepID=UPI001E5502ED|nr:LysR family transcriptional regulator [Massilia antarctica]MCE3605394.1 LysR family transcriptional regulator [Massilia antarctica]